MAAINSASHKVDQLTIPSKTAVVKTVINDAAAARPFARANLDDGAYAGCTDS